MDIQLRGWGEPVSVTDVAEEGDLLTGRNSSGKRFVTRKERVREEDALTLVETPEGMTPAVEHPYRVYVEGHGPIRVVAPVFAETEAWLNVYPPDPLTVLLEDGSAARISPDATISLLSARPDDDPAQTAPEQEPATA